MSCTRHQEQALRLERGELPDEHERSCPACQAARAAHAQVAAALASAGQGARPPIGWQARVMAELSAAERRPSLALRLAPAVVGLALAVAGIGGLFVHRKQAQEKAALEAERAALRNEIVDSLARVRRTNEATQELLAQLASEQDEAKRAALQQQLAFREEERRTEEERLQALRLRKAGVLKASGKAKPSAGPSGMNVKACDPEDPLCGL